MEGIEHVLTSQLIAQVTDMNQENPNFAIQMEIVDRIKQSSKESKTVAQEILKSLKSTNSKKVVFTIELLEMCSKNGNQLFHKYLAQNEFSEMFLTLLKRKRGKGGIFKKFQSKPVKIRWERAENQLLYLIQMWSDTFMMQEDEYPGFQKVYRQLRKENIIFPVRDANVRMFMGNLTKESPMFDFIEQLAGKPTPHVQTKQNKEEQELDRKEKQLQEKDEIDRVEQMQFEDNENDEDLALMKVDSEELEIIKSSLQILEDIQMSAESLDEMKSEIATDIYQTCLMMRRRVARIVQAKSFQNMDVDCVVELLEVIDYIDKKLEMYKKRYLKFKEKAIKQIQKKKSQLQNKNKEMEKKKEVEKPKQKKKEKKVKAQEQNVDLLDIGQEPQQVQNAEEESKDDDEEIQEDESQEEQKVEVKENGFKKLQAPPTSKSHTLAGMQKMKQKLQMQYQPQQNNNEDIMDLLIDLDIKGNETIQQQEKPKDQIDLLFGLQGLTIGEQQPQKQQQKQPGSDDFFSSLANRSDG